ncbi:peptide-methionine (S)-S-oxide reductase MsrA [Roseovarius sp. C7]|uniref:peptide-methionine (S)-S-oxide reductase MsrA n=1 Tax=Roseovarius sp. C7 TaxID=3398643 RepID=UPI0039F74228
MKLIHPLKSAALALAIVLGCLAHANPAQAADKGVLTVAGGCFWCVEADFESVPGVSEVVSGYTGGTVKNPGYKQVTGGNTGHYEAVQIHYDPARVSRDTLLSMFFRSIDPTDAGGQFCDRGASYRSAIFVSDPAERAAAEAAKQAAAKALGQKIVTPILPAATFYTAEDYHQDYYKGTKLVLTRGGPKSQSKAYKFYREGCRRDQRVKELWGSAAPFTG